MKQRNIKYGKGIKFYPSCRIGEGKRRNLQIGKRASQGGESKEL